MALIGNHTALYSPLDIEYNQAMSGPYTNWSYTDGALCKRTGTEDGECVAGEKNGKITGFWRPVVCTGSKDFQEEQIEGLWKISQDIFYEDFLIDGQLSPISKFLLEKGYKAEPYYTQVIDLRLTEGALHSEIRKSYKSLCNSGVCFKGCTYEVQKIHEKMHGEKTRPNATWSIQQKMGFTLINAQKTAGVIFYTGDIWAYYACSASIGDANTHHLIWNGLLECKKQGCQFLEMGEIHFGNDIKLKNIGHFKMGFGGQTQKRLRLRKSE